MTPHPFIRLTLILSAALVAARAQTPESLPAKLSAQDRPGIAAGSVLDLTLEDAILMVIRNSADIEASRLDLETAKLNFQAAQGVYDPNFTWDTRYQKKATPVSSILGGAADGRLNETNLSLTPSVGGLMPWGGNWSVGGYGQKQTSSSLFVPLNPQYLSGLTFRFNQPLLRDRDIDAPRRGIRIASRNRDISVDQFRARVIQLVSQTAKTYFDLLAAQENLDIQRNAYEQAQRNLETNQRMAAQGLLATSDVISARAQVAAYETAWYRALDAVATVENALKNAMLPSRFDPLWRAWLRPVSKVEAEASRIQEVLKPVDEAIDSAMRLRPELSQVKTMGEIGEINTQYFRSQTRPQLDLYSSYLAQGLAGLLAPRAALAAIAGFPAAVPPGLIGGVGTGLLSVLNANYPTFEGGVRLTIPIRNRTAEANLGLAEVDARRIRNQANQLERSIVAEVRNAAQSVNSAQARLAAARVSRDSAQLEYESQQRKLQVGLTSVFQLLQEQTNLVEAQSRELQARNDLRKSVIEMERTTGRTLDVYQIDVDKASVSSTSRPPR
jgi:outer membrane protein